MKVMNTIIKKIKPLFQKQSNPVSVSNTEKLEQLHARVAQLESSVTLILQRLVQLNINHKTPHNTAQTNQKSKVYLVQKQTPNKPNKTKSFTEKLDLLPPHKEPTYH